MKKLCALMMILVVPLFGACSDAANEPADTPSKDDVRRMSGKGDGGQDLCEAFGWYGDGVCDDFCPAPDPDCGGGCEADADCGDLEICVPNTTCAGLDCPTGLCESILDRCSDGSPAICEIVPPQCPAGTILEVVGGCFGQCVDPLTCEPPVVDPFPCHDGSTAICEIVPPQCPDGLVIEVVNGCFGDCVDPDTCEPVEPLGDCSDGSLAICEIVPPECPPGLVLEVVNGCFGECVDPQTCEPPPSLDGCGDGSLAICEIVPPQCPPGLVLEVVGGCFGECVDPVTCEAPPLCGGLLGQDCGADAYCDFPDGDMCSFADGAGLCVPRPQVCPAVLDPVCGCDGVTYDNSCDAQVNGTDIASRGPC